MTPEMQLLSRIITTGDLNTPTQWGITQSDFLTSEGRGWFNMLVGHNSAHGGTVLGPNAVMNQFPNFQLCDDPSVTTEYLCHRVRQQRLKTNLNEQMLAATALANTDIVAAINLLQASVGELQNLSQPQNTDVHFADSFARTINRMEMMEQGYDFSCGMWPWHPLQDETGGLQHDDYVVIYGRPKNFKTFIIAFLLSWYIECGKRILVYTKEMTADNIWQRAGAAIASVRYREFRRGKLSQSERKSIYETQAKLQQMQITQAAVCLSAKDAQGADTVPWLRSKIERYQPEVVFVDGMYLMSDVRGNKKDHERVRSISRDLRQTVLDTNIPLIATVQANRAAAKNQEANLDEIAFSDALGQDATILMRCIKEKDKNTIALIVGGSREFELNGFRVYGIPMLDFGYAGPLTDKDIEKAKEQDKPEAAKNGTPAAKGKGKLTESKAQDVVITSLNKELP